MGIRFASIAVCSLLWLATAPGFAAAQKKQPASAEASPSNLQQHYDSAQHLQQAGKTDQAAVEYRAFIAEAVGELASGYASAGNYKRADELFDESLAMSPNQPALRMAYARAALEHGDFARAKSLAEQLLASDSVLTKSADAKPRAKAHLILGQALMKMNQDKQARKELETAVALDPDFEDGYALAVTCLDMDDGKCAERIFSEMQASFGDTAVIHMEFGRAYANSDFPGKAVAEFKKAIAKNDRLPEAHYSLAAAYLASGETSAVEKARVELEKELRVSPKDFLTYAALGHIAVIQHRYDDAKKFLTRAIALNPANPDAYLYLGQMEYEMRQSAQAEAALRQAIAHTTDASRNRYQIQKAHYLLGRLLIKDGREAEGQAEMKIVQKMMARTLAADKSRFSGSAPAGTGMGGVGIAAAEQPAKPADTKAARAISEFEKQVAPPLADSYNNLGATAASGKDYAAALIDFRRAAEWNPALPGLDYNWGRAAFLGSHFQDAVPPLTRYLAAHPEDANIRQVLAISLFMTKDYTGVVKTLEPILSRVDAVPQVEYVYAASLMKAGQREAGIERLEAMEKKNPSIPDVHRSLGEAYAQGGAPDQQKAAAEFATAIRINSKDAQSHFELGELDLRTGEVKAALVELETAARLDPGNAEMRSKLAEARRRDSGADGVGEQQRTRTQGVGHPSPK